MIRYTQNLSKKKSIIGSLESVDRSCTQKNWTYTQTCNGSEKLKNIVVYRIDRDGLWSHLVLATQTTQQNFTTRFLCNKYIIHTLHDFYKSYVVYNTYYTFHVFFSQPHWLPLRSLGEPGSTGTKPLPPKTGRMNESSNFRHNRWTVWVGVDSKARRLFGRWISWPSRSASESRESPRSGTMNDFGVVDSVVVMLLVILGWGSRSLMSGLVSKPNTW